MGTVCVRALSVCVLVSMYSLCIIIVARLWELSVRAVRVRACLCVLLMSVTTSSDFVCGNCLLVSVSLCVLL